MPPLTTSARTARLLAMYARSHRRLPRLRSPQTFTEKLLWRILNDRRSCIAAACDKVGTKALVDGIVDCPTTIWTGADVSELADLDLTGRRWVLKPNHRSGLVHFGEGSVDPAAIRSITSGWLEGGTEERLGEWGYSRARRCLVLEERLGVGAPPADVKFFTFGGRVSYIQHDTDRFNGHQRRLYSPTWEPLPARVAALPEAPVVAPPAPLDRMLAVASALGERYDFIRVDLYDVDGAIYLGELTPYHGSGLEAYAPRSFDVQVGSEWTLPTSVVDDAAVGETT